MRPMPTTRKRRPTLPGVPDRLKPRKLPRQARAQALVEAVIEAGSRILVDVGYERLSMQRVAEVAGVSPGSLYQYFPSREALVAAIVEAQSRRELAFHLERFAAIPRDATLEDALTTVLGSVLAFQRAEGPLMRRTLEALQHLGRFEVLQRRAADAAAVLRGLLEAHRETLALDDPALATHVLANAVHSLTHDGVLPRPASLDDDTLLRELVRLCLGYLGQGSRGESNPHGPLPSDRRVE